MLRWRRTYIAHCNGSANTIARYKQVRNVPGNVDQRFPLSRQKVLK